jgi:hypothetical protein
MYSVSKGVQHQLVDYSFVRTAKTSFLEISSESKPADAIPEALCKVMAKQLYNDTMVRSQRGAFTSAKLDSGETVDDLSKRLQDLAVSVRGHDRAPKGCLPISSSSSPMWPKSCRWNLSELDGATGDTVLLQLFTDALPEELQVNAYGINGDYDHLVVSLSRIQKTLAKKDKPGVTRRARCAEQTNKVVDGAGVYHDDDLSMEEVVQAIQVWRAGRKGRDEWREGPERRVDVGRR